MSMNRNQLLAVKSRHVRANPNLDKTTAMTSVAMYHGNGHVGINTNNLGFSTLGTILNASATPTTSDDTRAKKYIRIALKGSNLIGKYSKRQLANSIFNQLKKLNFNN